jgi:hypothetical protein
MPADVPLSALDLFRAAASEADGAETALRARYAEDLKAVERARVFANRRLALMMALCSGVQGAQDDASAYAAGEKVLQEEMGLSRTSAAHVPLIDAFRPVIDLLDTLLNCEDEAAPQSAVEALGAYEVQYRSLTGQEFFALYDVYRSETPVVDF